MPLTTSRPELLSDGRDREFRHLVHALFGFAAHHEQIRAGHGAVIGLAGIEYTVLISVAHLSLDGDVSVKAVADHLYLSGAFITAVTQRLVKLGNMTNAQVAAAQGAFDTNTETALRQFQLQNGLPPSGVLDVLTYRSLLTAVPPSAPLLPTTGSEVDTVLPDSGRGFATFNREIGGADQFGRASTILAIQSIGAAWAETHTFPIFIGDISRKGGGSFPPHSSHKDGRDVDMRPFRHNGQPGATNINDPSYGHGLTRELVLLVRQKFRDLTILFNDKLLVKDGLTKPFAGHDNHLHVRFS
jgi:hypothetical protein